MSQIVSACQYLYGKPSAQVFTRRHLSEAVVDQCLETLMHVHVYLLSCKDIFFLIQPTAYNDQCHLYSLRVLHIMRHYGTKTDVEKHSRTEENRFLHLSLMLSFAFIINPHFYLKMVREGLQVLKKQDQIAAQLPTKKALCNFVEELSSTACKKAARMAYNQIFTSYAHHLVQQMNEGDGSTALDQELVHLFTTENLFLAPRIGEGDTVHAGREISLYTPPKFAGVTLLHNIITLEEIPFAIKVMVITAQGIGIHSCLSRPVQENEGVLIFESFATDGILSLQECRQTAMRCPSYHRKTPTLAAHPEATCLFCNPTQIDLTPYRKRLSLAMQNPQKLLLALGADYSLSTPGQARYLNFFNDAVHYPHLTALFQEGAKAIDVLGVSEKKPLTFSVSFVHAGRGSDAMSRNMLSNRSCKDILAERGVFHQVKKGERQ